MHWSPAITSAFLTMYGGAQLAVSSIARAAAWAYGPPLPMARMPVPAQARPVAGDHQRVLLVGTPASLQAPQHPVGAANPWPARRRCAAGFPGAFRVWPRISRIGVNASAVPPQSQRVYRSPYKAPHLARSSLDDNITQGHLAVATQSDTAPRRTERMVVPRYCSIDVPNQSEDKRRSVFARLVPWRSARSQRCRTGRRQDSSRR